MLLPLVCVAFAGLSNALSVNQPLYPRQNMSTPLKSASIPSGAISGVATFVIFPHQTSTVCGPFSGTSLAASVPTTERGAPPSPEYQATYAKIGDNGAFGAAAGSISPGFGPGGRCSGSIDMVRDFSHSHLKYSMVVPHPFYSSSFIRRDGLRGIECSWRLTNRSEP